MSTTTTTAPPSSQQPSFLPLASLSVLLLCTLLHASFSLFSLPLFSYTLCPRLVLGLVNRAGPPLPDVRAEPHRLVTSAFLHADVVHLAFNMMSTYHLAPLLERRYGTFFFLHLLLLLTVLNSVLYTLTAYTLYAAGSDSGLLDSHAVGFSGTIFAFLVLSNSLPPPSSSQTSSSSRTLFGYLTVPKEAYPWALLLALQVLMPTVSFLGHLGGILVGEAASRGLLSLLLLPVSFCSRLETVGPFRFIAAARAYSPPAGGFEGLAGDGRGWRGVLADLAWLLRSAAKVCADAASAARTVARGSREEGERLEGGRRGGGGEGSAREAAVRRAEEAALLERAV